MPIQTAVLTAAGAEPGAIQAESLRAFADQEPPGVYTVTRTYRGTKVVLFDAHLDRLEESAELEGIPLALDREKVRASLRALIEGAGYGDCRLRITVPSGAPDQILLAVEPLPRVPPRVKEEGVRAATVSLARENPRAKSNMWVSQRKLARDRLPTDTYEGMLIDSDGRILEGFSSNFYAIRDGILQTAEADILKGISRRILLEVIPSSLAVQYKPPKLEELPLIDETFLTSSSRGVVPIVRINESPVGTGRPGPRTVDLSARYDQWVDDHLEPL